MSNKAARYSRIISQLEPLLAKSPDYFSAFATINALLYHKIQYIFWCGFYYLKSDNLVVGPYQGPLACQELEKNKGVCWHTINQKTTTIVPDVHAFPDHIACDSRSKSEIVIPVFSTNREIVAVLDLDSDQLAAFDKTDAEYLEKMIRLIQF